MLDFRRGFWRKEVRIMVTQPTIVKNKDLIPFLYSAVAEINPAGGVYFSEERGAHRQRKRT